MTQFELSEFLSDMPTLFYCGFKAEDIGQSLYKIHDDSVRLRNFLGVDNEDKIEAILSEQVLDIIEPKLTCKEVLNSLILAFRKTCLEIFPKWIPQTITIASSSGAKKMSLHISTFGMRLPNITQVAVFTELIHVWISKFDEKTEEYVHIKKPVHSKDGTLFDFMIRPPNDESEVVKSSFLDIPKAEMGDVLA
ncbi:hypothetical protein C1646_777698 [Rhizophagus diaphanus]|nr:hypothetical protein C1646_777698 [Rhizophagus diaphanus] [Rhizophagus sp. MUCL 43196]